MENELKKNINELLSVLDDDAAYMQENLTRLDQLRGFVVKRDDKSLDKIHLY